MSGADLPRLVTDAMTAIESEFEPLFGVLPNAWLGVSVEDRKYGVPRIDYLRKFPAAMQFLSIEPLPQDWARVNW